MAPDGRKKARNSGNMGSEALVRSWRKGCQRRHRPGRRAFSRLQPSAMTACQRLKPTLGSIRCMRGHRPLVDPITDLRYSPIVQQKRATIALLDVVRRNREAVQGSLPFELALYRRLAVDTRRRNRGNRPSRFRGVVSLQQPALLPRHRRILGLREAGLSRPLCRPRGARRIN
jgi:hypothetical protein